MTIAESFSDYITLVLRLMCKCVSDRTAVRSVWR